MQVLAVAVFVVFVFWVVENWGWYLLGGIMFSATVFGIIFAWVMRTPEWRDHQKKIKQEEDERKARERLPVEFEGCPQYVGERGKIAVNASNRTFGIFNHGSWHILNFEDLRDAEIQILENGTTYTTGSRSLIGAAVGGLIFGPAGAVVGGLGRRTQSKTISHPERVILSVHTKHIEKPIFELEFGSLSFNSAGWSVTLEDVKVANEWLSRVKIAVDARDFEASKS